ncbi:MAG: pyridoxal-phosphate dependent enzyme [Halofilum sp. (in: g-proteobacteria)]|nr:pyridoxal-phosphate dependent enzyme [Halofilum sp. (in: g-proteobacteria)]
MADTGIPTHEDIVAAHDRIRPWIHRTPVLTSATLDRMSGAELAFKCENLQQAGAFKVRGAGNAVLGLPEAQADAGVATHSSGNHGAALCWAAGRRGIPATVVMPEGASRAKVRAVEAYGGTIVTCGPTLEARERTLAEVTGRTGATFVHPYDDARVIAGQATCAVELHEDAGLLDAVVAPVGGGGLVSGTALALATLAPGTRIYAAEPANADDAHRSLHAGERVAAASPDTIADGLRASLGELTWHVLSRHVSDVLLLSEARIVDAMRLVWERMKIVIEPSSAVAVAAVLDNPRLFAGRRVGVILTGGNVDLDALPW